MIYFKKPFIALSLLGLTACSSYQEGFDCPAGIGVGCKSLSTVDQMIEQGQLPKAVPEDDRVEALVVLASSRLNYDSQVRQEIDPQPSRLSVSRIPEQSVRVWIKGYTDGQGNTHDHAVIYTVVQPASWQVDGKPQNRALQTAPTILSTPLHAEVPHES